MSEVPTSDKNPYVLDIGKIQKYLPHRFPFLMIDRVLEIHPVGSLDDLSPNDKVGIRVVAQKNVSMNEPQFQGHFPSYAIMPGVLQIEAMAQAASFSLYPYLARDLDRLAKDLQTILIGVDGVRFRRPVVPGDVLRIETVVTKARGKIWAFECKCTVDGERVAEAELLANLTTSGVTL
jgi:3-hydroxyacyl-[acyl-carrier-protein] dehydratase